MTSTRRHLLNAGVLGLAIGLIMPGFAWAQDKADDPDFGLGGSARQLRLTRGLLEVASESAPPGTRTQGYSVEFARRGKQLEFVLGFGYDNLEASNGYYLETAGDPLVPGQVDFVEFDGLHVYTLDATLVGYLHLHKILAIRYGAGLGIALVRGHALRTDSICTSERIDRDCAPDPDGAQQQEPVAIPKAIPVLEGLVGLQFRPTRALAINIDFGLRNVPYVGLSGMFYLW